MRWILVPALLLLSTGSAPAQDLDVARLRLAQRHYGAGLDFVRQEQFAAAVPEFKAAVGYDPLLAAAHYEMGRALAALRRYDEAVGAYRSSREAYATLERLTRADADERWRVIEQAWSRERVREGRARHVHQVAEPPELALALGSAYFRMGNLPEAEREYLRAVGARPAFGEAHNNLAVVYLQTGRPADAAQAVRAAESAGYRVHPQLKEEIGAGRQ